MEIVLYPVVGEQLQRSPHGNGIVVALHQTSYSAQIALLRSLPAILQNRAEQRVVREVEEESEPLFYWCTLVLLGCTASSLFQLPPLPQPNNSPSSSNSLPFYPLPYRHHQLTGIADVGASSLAHMYSN